jgi:hypothetical protein
MTLIPLTSYLDQRLSRACIVHLVIKRTNWSYVKTISCSGTTWTIETKLPRNDHWKVLYKVSVFYADWKSKMAATTAGHSLTLEVVSEKKCFETFFP